MESYKLVLLDPTRKCCKCLSFGKRGPVSLHSSNPFLGIICYRQSSSSVQEWSKRIGLKPHWLQCLLQGWEHDSLQPVTRGPSWDMGGKKILVLSQELATADVIWLAAARKILLTRGLACLRMMPTQRWSERYQVHHVLSCAWSYPTIEHFCHMNQ